MKFLKLYLSIMLTTLIIFLSFTSTFAAKKQNIGYSPIASNINISGPLEVGKVLTGTYLYSDKNSDLEGLSKYRWLSSTSLTGTYSAILGATSKTYALTSADAGKYIKFEVTPVAKTGTPSTGTSVLSTAVGPVIQPASNSKTVLGFTVKYYSTDVTSYNSMVNNKASIDQIATATFSADALGGISGTAPVDQVSYAVSNGIKPLALINNADANGFNKSIASSIVNNPAYKQSFINNMVNILKSNNYSGVNIDFENISYADRAAYTSFINDVKNALSPLGQLITISVPAKTVDSTSYSWTYAYDYQALGSLADKVILMTYDEHGPWCEPGPVASIGWVTNVVNYAKTVIPANKIMLGLAAYGYDWSAAGNKSLSLNKIDSLISTYGDSVQFDNTSQSPYYIYTDASGVVHTIWFENAQSIGYKLDLVNHNNLQGIAIWRLGLENSAFWGAINDKLSL